MMKSLPHPLILKKSMGFTALEIEGSATAILSS
jgi:hypothetical protein